LAGARDRWGAPRRAQSRCVALPRGIIKIKRFFEKPNKKRCFNEI